MKKIIYTTDFSDNSVSVLKYTYALSKLLQAQVIVLHVFFKEQPDSKLKLNTDERLIVQHHKKHIRDFCSLHLEQDFYSLNFSEAAVKGADISRAILLFVRDIKISLLVMGTSRKGNLKKLFLGSTVSNMLVMSPFPLLIVPPGYVFKNLEKILYTSDLQLKDIYNIGELVKIINPINSEIIIIHVSKEDNLMNKNLLNWFKKSLREKITYPNIKLKTIFSEDIFESLKLSLDESQADIVSMMERKHKPEINYVLHRDLVKRMQSSLTIPLLSFNEIS
jgi:nucleotide-binding universal stress UspA family protein